MGLFKLKTALTGLATVLFSASLFADCTVDDNQDGTNQNEFEYYWYYYDDIGGIKKDDRMGIPEAGKQPAGVGTRPTVIDVKYTAAQRHALGNTADTAKIKVYTFQLGTEGENKYAQMPFSLGSTWTASYGDAYPFAGIGTMLCKDGASLDMTGMTKITFKARAHVKALSCIFKLQTKDIDACSTFAYFQKTFSAPKGTWSDVIEVNIPTDIAQPAWAKGTQVVPFDITKITKMAWEVPGDKNGVDPEAPSDVIIDTLDIDDIKVVGYTYVSRFLWTKTADMSAIPQLGEFATFDIIPKNQSPLMTYWYAYNDAKVGMEGKAHGTSSVDEQYAALDADTKLLKLSIKSGYGSGGTGSTPGCGGTIQYKLGPSIQKDDTTLVQGFVGIGCNLYDSTKCQYFAAKDSGAKSIYFHYMVYSANIKYISLEISDSADVIDATHPNGDRRGSGVVYFVNLPNTNGEWKAVEVPFDSLKYHDDWATAKNVPFDPNHIAKIQWKVQGTEGEEGIYSIDNVFFPGMRVWPSTVPVVQPLSHSVKSSAFRASYLNGNVCISWDNASITSGKISLINTKGAIVKSTSIAKANSLKANFSAKELPAGMYFVKINAVNGNGKTVVKQSPINILK